MTEKRAMWSGFIYKLGMGDIEISLHLIKNHDIHDYWLRIVDPNKQWLPLYKLILKTSWLLMLRLLQSKTLTLSQISQLPIPNTNYGKWLSLFINIETMSERYQKCQFLHSLVETCITLSRDVLTTCR